MQAQGMRSAGQGDNTQRFLADLRALRDAAALGFDELAARTHYPDDILKEAESGPCLPGLPVLAAYVRACDGDVPEWEERWRQLGFDADADPGLPVRAAGASPAAVAGARASAGVAPPDVYDPDRIRAVLKGIHGHSAVSRGGAAVSGRIDAKGTGPATVAPRPQESAGAWSAGPSQDRSWGGTAPQGLPEAAEDTSRLELSWETGYQLADRTAFQPDERTAFQPDERTAIQPDERTGFQHGASDLSGGQASASPYRAEPSGIPFTEDPDEVQADAIRRDPFSAEWLRDSELVSQQRTDSGWHDHPEARPSPAATDSWFTRPEPDAREVSRPAAADAATEAWFAPRELADAGLAPPFMPGRRGDNGTAAPFAPDERVAAGFRPPAEEHTVSRVSWPEAADIAPPDAPGTGDGTESASRPDVSLTPPGATLGSSVPSGPAKPTGERRSDRLWIVRLLVVIVAAALIGSALVLLLH